MTREIPITALMSIKNGEIWFKAARQSVTLNMNETDEIVLINDDSSDSTWQLMNEWAASDPRVRLLQNSNPGLANALNLGLKTATNEWVARFDVDDHYEAYRVSEQRKLIDDDVVAIFCDYSVRDPKGNSMGEFLSAVEDKAIRVSLSRNTRTPHPGVIFRRSSALKVGGYSQRDFPVEDLSLWVRLQSQGKFVSVPRSLFTYTLNGGSVTGLRRKEMIARRSQLIRADQELRQMLGELRSICKSVKPLYSETSNGIGRRIFLTIDGFYLHRIYGHRLLAYKFAILEFLPMLTKGAFYNYLFELLSHFRRRYAYRKKMGIS